MQACFATPRHAWQRPRPTSACFAKSLADLGMLFQGPKSPTSKKPPPPICCLISCKAKGVVYHQASIYETWWYTIPLALQLIRQQLGGFFFDVGLLGPCEKACRGCRGRCEACLGRCQACLGVAKQAYTSQVPTKVNADRKSNQILKWTPIVI